MSGNTDDVDDEITRYFFAMQINKIKKRTVLKKKNIYQT